MTAELSQEDVVTQLLISNEIVKKPLENMSISTTEMAVNSNLGQLIKEDASILSVNKPKLDKYSFINHNLWKI